MTYGHAMGSRIAQVQARSEALSRALFLLAAGISFALSIALWFTGNHEQALFVGLWVPSILSLGALMRGTRS